MRPEEKNLIDRWEDALYKLGSFSNLIYEGMEVDHAHIKLYPIYGGWCIIN